MANVRSPPHRNHTESTSSCKAEVPGPKRAKNYRTVSDQFEAVHTDGKVYNIKSILNKEWQKVCSNCNCCSATTAHACYDYCCALL